jgi:mono/diheme cytochrome c family protein
MSEALKSLRRQVVFGCFATVIITATAFAALRMADSVRAQAKRDLITIDVSQYQPASVPRGRARFLETCASCHGSSGAGMPKQGANLRFSTYIADHQTGELAAFIRNGRTPGDPLSVMQLPMPPKGGNANLTEQQLIDIAAYLHELQKQAKEDLQADAQTNATR